MRRVLEDAPSHCRFTTPHPGPPPQGGRESEPRRRGWLDRGLTAVMATVLFAMMALTTVDVIGRYFIPGDVHWNADGHALVASHFLSVWRPPS